MCANDSGALPDQTLNFIKSHPLMDRPVSAAGQQPIVVQAGFRSALCATALVFRRRRIQY